MTSFRLSCRGGGSDSCGLCVVWRQPASCWFLDSGVVVWMSFHQPLQCFALALGLASLRVCCPCPPAPWLCLPLQCVVSLLIGVFTHECVRVCVCVRVERENRTQPIHGQSPCTVLSAQVPFKLYMSLILSNQVSHALKFPSRHRFQQEKGSWQSPHRSVLWRKTDSAVGVSARKCHQNGSVGEALHYFQLTWAVALHSDPQFPALPTVVNRLDEKVSAELRDYSVLPRPVACYSLVDESRSSRLAQS